MNSIAKLMDELAVNEGINTTHIKGVQIYKTIHPQPRQPLCYKQGVIIIGQGSKRVFLGNQIYEYNADNYLVLSVPMPAECETRASEKEPLLAMLVDIDLMMLNQIIEKMEDAIHHRQQNQPSNNQGLFVAQALPEFKGTVTRLLQTLQNETESNVLGQSIIHELMFHILRGENATSLYTMATKNTTLSRMSKVLQQIHANYRQSIDVHHLAGLANMSTSAFHREFKEITSSSPIQYLKGVRLNKAKNLLLQQGMRVNIAATEVGYESASQFSREFKRYFGHSPVQYRSSLTTNQTP